ncbi:unnamed protein product, partial [Aphanomyces euteiches]
VDGTQGRQWYGPFPITKIVSEVSYRLSLPAEWQCSDMFYVGKLKSYIPRSTPDLGSNDPMAQTTEMARHHKPEPTAASTVERQTPEALQQEALPRAGDRPPRRAESRGPEIDDEVTSTDFLNSVGFETPGHESLDQTMGHSGADHENENVHENETYANESGVQQSENENDAPRSRVQTPTAGVKPIEKDQK